MVSGIDLQQTVLQSPAAEKVQQTHQQHPDMQQRYFAGQLQEERRQLREKINRPDEADKALIREEGGRRQGEQQMGGRQREGAAPEAEPEEGHGTLINIKI
jgi:hypothetical protein